MLIHVWSWHRTCWWNLIKFCSTVKQLRYCYNNANYTIAFLNEKGKLFEMLSPLCKVLLFTGVKLCKRPEVNSESTHFVSKGISWFRWHVQLLRWHWQAKRYCISWDLQKSNLLENNPNNTRNNMNSQIKTKKNRKISSWNY